MTHHKILVFKLYWVLVPVYTVDLGRFKIAITLYRHAEDSGDAAAAAARARPDIQGLKACMAPIAHCMGAT